MAAGKRESDDASSNESLHGSEAGGSDNEMPFLSRHSVQLGRGATRKALPTDGEELDAAASEQGASELPMEHAFHHR